VVAVAALMVELELQVLGVTVAVLQETSGRRARLQMQWNPLAVVAVVAATTKTTLRRTIAVDLVELVLFCCHMQCRVKNSPLIKRADPRCFSIKCPLDLHRVLQTSLHLPMSPHLMR
jgi:hypothetical protein